MSLVSYQFCDSCVPSYCPPYCNREKISSGTLYLNCERLKHNGLQDDCKRMKCEKNEGCFAVQKARYCNNRRRENTKCNGLQECVRGRNRFHQDIYENSNTYSNSLKEFASIR